MDRATPLGSLKTATRSALRRPFWPRLGGAVAVFAVAAAVALALVLSQGGTAPARTLRLTGAGGAAATVELLPAAGAVRAVVMHVTELAPAPPRHYYVMSFASGGDSVEALSFDMPASRTLTLRTTAPAHMRWDGCWVAIEAVGSGHQRPVLHLVGSA